MGNMKERLEILQSILNKYTFWPGTRIELNTPVNDDVVLLVVRAYFPNVESCSGVEDLFTPHKWTMIFRTWSMNGFDFLQHPMGLIVEVFRERVQQMCKDMWDHEFSEWMKFDGDPIREPVHESR